MTAATTEHPLAISGIEPGSFRDRTARVFYRNGSVFRGLTTSAREQWESVAATSFFKQGIETRRIVATEVLSLAAAGDLDPSMEWAAVLRHQTIPFVSYPYEWGFGMLKDAALLQLQLLEDALAEGITLKDATPFNVQWIGSNPIFIDVASFVRWSTGEPWAGYRQFCRMFLYSLFLQAYKNVPFHPWLRGRLDGISAEECARLMSCRDVLRPGVLSHVIAQRRFEHRYADTARDIRRELRQVRFDKRLILTNLARMKKLVSRLTWEPATSVWSEYACENSYGQNESMEKEQFVENILASKKTRIVWDLGCNTGRFANLAARHAEYVVAIDSDHQSIERFYGELRRDAVHNILPLVMDVADPSPGLGWRGTERQPLLQRGRPDVVMCLALIHHLAITSNLPITDLVDWFAEIRAGLIIEFPTPDDPMVKRLLLNKDAVYSDYCVEYFENVLSARFDIRNRLTLSSGTRILYYATPQKTS